MVPVPGRVQGAGLLLKLHGLSVKSPGHSIWTQSVDGCEEELCPCTQLDVMRHRESVVLRVGELPDGDSRALHIDLVTLVADVELQGVRVPEVLRKYIPGAPEFIEYTKELPKDTTSSKAKSKASGPKAVASPSTSAATEEMNKLRV